MPIPQPRAGENRSDFMGRCVSFLRGEGRSRNQAVAICSDQYNDERKKTILWKRLDNKKARFERKHVGTVKSAFDKQLEHVRDQFSRAGNADVIVNDDIMKAAYKEMYQDVFPAFGIRGYNQAKTGSWEIQRKQSEEEVRNRLIENAGSYIDTEGAAMVAKVNSYTNEQVKAVVNKYSQRIIDEGLSIERGSELLNAELNTLTDSRARRIVRTEVNRAANLGGLEGADMSGIPYKKSWLATRDARVRVTHIQAEDNNPPVQRNETFNVGGEQLQYPGDPRGSAAETINCRCALQYIPQETNN